MATYLSTDLVPRVPCYSEFMNTMVRRNVPDLGIPPIRSTLVWIDLTNAERAIQQNLNHSPISQLMSCNHFHLARGVLQFAGNDENLTIAQVSRKLQEGRLNEIYVINRDIEDRRGNAPRWRSEIMEAEADRAKPEEARRERRVNEETGWEEKPWPRDYDKEILVRETKIENERLAVEKEPLTIRKRAEQKKIQQQHDFFDDLVQKLSELKPETCPVCLDDVCTKTNSK
jgi:hypothetical protein